MKKPSLLAVGWCTRKCKIFSIKKLFIKVTVRDFFIRCRMKGDLLDVCTYLNTN